ncbi:MAG: hypothetical protein JWL65_1976 [Gammaproteobacteria bacterium]|nr:hypothetical protein [Gammaproteobacteria bacterium]
MGIESKLLSGGKFDGCVEAILTAARIPGAGVAIVAGGETVFAKGYGHRALQPQLPTNAQTIYPIASTTKAINATLLGILVEEGQLGWDMPVQHYLPKFRLGDAWVSANVTLRDLVIMRTGLPRHDWLWVGNPMSRAELVERLRYLELSAGFRERFQYNNMTATTAGYIAEVVTGQGWNDLVRERLLEPLGMKSTRFTRPTTANVTLSYHENSRRELVLTQGLEGEVTAPSGGAVYSSVEDMARWLLFNLNAGSVNGRQLMKPETLAEIHSPQIIASLEQGAPTAQAGYAMGWFVDTYNAHPRLSHGGYLHDVHSDVMFFPKQGMAMVSYTNFGCPGVSRLLNQYAFDLLMDLTPVQTVEQKIAEYEKKIEAVRERQASTPRVRNSTPSHPIGEYAGRYSHPGYGYIDISVRGEQLTFHRHTLALPLEHWHYDAWVPKDRDLFVIHVPHAFDATSRFLFETNVDGAIAAISIGMEPAVRPIRFEKQ